MEFFGCEGYGRGNEAARSLFEGAVILTPGVSFANVGQLTVDLLVNSLLVQEVDMKLVGHLYSKHVPPMAGSSAFATQSSSGLCLNLAVFLLSHPSSVGHPTAPKVVFVQQRTSINAGQVQAFCDDFAVWASSTCRASQVVVLSGVDNMLRHDSNMQQRRIQWTSTEKSTLLNEAFLHQFQPLAASNDPEVDQAHGIWDTVRGAGVAPKLIDACNSRAIPALALLLHCAEGNNVPDAVFFASCVVQYLWLHTIIQSFRLVLPPSWAQLYGRDPAIALYA
ncbi:hypothetical protein H257_05865 [Aphanomyces astaci]|uniref:Proteasome assembly chaperone 2 n=1 Tax=Aphanomyces astaci TaxID=112090 RepID=W4GNL8_APHAT|nr:hypothetical protein H257_05865 [Aphanomyces astaci]ETV81310.1 hypothetical protein H257_05865 [Aphanomyces astaci]|eukprot:XP_009829168.1 hypothetical protein H257_05865 [Aphanomyces astaci]